MFSLHGAREEKGVVAGSHNKLEVFCAAKLETGSHTNTPQNVKQFLPAATRSNPGKPHRTPIKRSDSLC